jgi:hypothetical protein
MLKPIHECSHEWERVSSDAVCCQGCGVTIGGSIANELLALAKERAAADVVNSYEFRWNTSNGGSLKDA